MSYRFTWDENKAAANIIAHQGVSFDEASTVFDDPLARIFADEVHSFAEKREIIIGHWTFDEQSPAARLFYRAPQRDHSYHQCAATNQEGT